MFYLYTRFWDLALLNVSDIYLPQRNSEVTVCCCFCSMEKKKGVENEGLGLEINQSPGEEALRHFGPALVVIRTACVVLEGIPAKMFYVS